jgi:hypothetical protein
MNTNDFVDISDEGVALFYGFLMELIVLSIVLVLFGLALRFALMRFNRSFRTTALLSAACTLAASALGLIVFGAWFGVFAVMATLLVLLGLQAPDRVCDGFAWVVEYIARLNELRYLLTDTFRFWWRTYTRP